MLHDDYEPDYRYLSRRRRSPIYDRYPFDDESFEDELYKKRSFYDDVDLYKPRKDYLRNSFLHKERRSPRKFDYFGDKYDFGVDYFKKRLEDYDYPYIPGQSDWKKYQKYREPEYNKYDYLDALRKDKEFKDRDNYFDLYRNSYLYKDLPGYKSGYNAFKSRLYNAGGYNYDFERGSKPYVYGRDYGIREARRPVKVTSDDLRLDLSRFRANYGRDDEFKKHYDKYDLDYKDMKSGGVKGSEDLRSPPGEDDLSLIEKDHKKDIRDKFKNLLSVEHARELKHKEEIRDKFKNLLSVEHAHELKRRDEAKEKFRNLLSVDNAQELKRRDEVRDKFRNFLSPEKAQDLKRRDEVKDKFRDLLSVENARKLDNKRRREEEDIPHIFGKKPTGHKIDYRGFDFEDNFNRKSNNYDLDYPPMRHEDKRNKKDRWGELKGGFDIGRGHNNYRRKNFF